MLLGFQGDGFSLELPENTEASQPPNENHMLEPDSLESRGPVLAALAWRLARAALPGELGGREKSEWQRSGHRDTVRTGGRDCGDATEEAGFFLCFLVVIKNNLRPYFKNSY